MTDQAKGLWITLLGVLFVVPDSLFVRLIASDAITIAYLRVTLVGLLIGAVLLLREGAAPFRAFARTGVFGLIYMIGLGGSGVLFVLAVSLTGGLVILPWAEPLSLPVSQWPTVALHVGTIAVSSVLLALGPRYITSAEVGLLVLLESVLAPLLAWWFLQEAPGGYALLGGVIVVGALFVSNLWVLRRAPRG